MNEWIGYIDKRIRKMSASAYITFETLLAINLIPEGKNENYDYLYQMLINNDDIRRFVATEANKTLLPPNKDPKETWVNVVDYPALSIISIFMNLSDENQKDIIEFMEDIVDFYEMEYYVSLKESIGKNLKRFTCLVQKNDEMSIFFEDVINILMNPIKKFFCYLENDYFSDRENEEKIHRKFINFFKAKGIDCGNKDEDVQYPNILIYMQELDNNFYMSEPFCEYLLDYMKYFILLSKNNNEESRSDDDSVFSTIEDFIHKHFNTYFVTHYLKPLEVDRKFWKVLQDPELKIEIRKNDWELFEEFKKTISLAANFTGIMFNFFHIGSQFFGTDL